MEQARFQVYNTTLFNEVNFELVAVDAANVIIHVHVTGTLVFISCSAVSTG